MVRFSRPADTRRGQGVPPTYRRQSVNVTVRNVEEQIANTCGIVDKARVIFPWGNNVLVKNQTANISFELKGKLLKGFSAIEKLNHDWDSYGGSVPSEGTLRSAKSICREFEPFCQPDIAPHADGSLGLYWTLFNREIVFSITGNSFDLLLESDGEILFEENELDIVNAKGVFEWLMREFF